MDRFMVFPCCLFTLNGYRTPRRSRQVTVHCIRVLTI